MSDGSTRNPDRNRPLNIERGHACPVRGLLTSRRPLPTLPTSTTFYRALCLAVGCEVELLSPSRLYLRLLLHQPTDCWAHRGASPFFFARARLPPTSFPLPGKNTTASKVVPGPSAADPP